MDHDTDPTDHDWRPSPAHREVRVVIVDDHAAIHAGVSAWCTSADPPLSVLATYYRPDAFLHEDRWAPSAVDVVLLDLELHSRQPDFDAVERMVAAGYRVVVYSHLEHHEVILRCLDLGAASYVSKSEGRQQLVEALHAAHVDRPHVGPRMAAAFCSDTRHGRPRLSAREIDVLKAWFQTESKDLVARRLHIEPSTVNTHLQRARAKYAAAGRPATTKAALLARAIQDGLIGVEDL